MTYCTCRSDLHRRRRSRKLKNGRKHAQQPRGRALHTRLLATSIVYSLVVGWLTYEGARYGGSNTGSALTYACLVALWPVASWAALLRPMVAWAPSWRATLLLMLATFQFGIAACLAFYEAVIFLHATSIVSPYVVLGLFLPAFYNITLWVWLTIELMVKRITQTKEGAEGMPGSCSA